MTRYSDRLIEFDGAGSPIGRSRNHHSSSARADFFGAIVRRGHCVARRPVGGRECALGSAACARHAGEPASNVRGRYPRRRLLRLRRGAADTAHYEMVGTHTTGHAELVRITFDPRRISYGQMLQIYFSVAHNPTELNRQGPDVGSQYRSAIFPTNPEQMRIAEAYIVQLNQAHVFDRAIVTKTEPGRDFYPAEDYHQDFLTRNPNYPYIVVNDLPKIEDLKRLFPDLYRPTPVPVAAAAPRN